MPTSYVRARLGGLFVLIAIILLDQWSKAAILNASAASHIPYEVLPVFNLVLVRNRGISFGLFSQMAPWMPGLLTALTSAIAAALAVWLARARDTVAPFALGLIIGGAAGNIADRVRLGAVTDFLDFHWQHYHWPAFNVADSAIFIGVVILVFVGIVRPPKEDA